MNRVSFYTDLRHLLVSDGELHVDVCMFVACGSGKLQLDVNTRTFTLQQNEILVCRPNDILNNSMMSPDFKGAVLCMPRREVLEQISVSQMWNSFFRVSENPIVSISPDAMQMFRLYGEAMQTKMNMEKTTFHSDSIPSICKAVLYELLDFVDEGDGEGDDEDMAQQSDVLFRNFIRLIASTPIKPRNVSWYASRLCISTKYLSIVCKKVTGKTAFHWINEYMMKDIRHLLKDTDKSVKEIADTLDFPSISFFGKYCRRCFGYSPKELRRQLRLPSE